LLHAPCQANKGVDMEAHFGICFFCILRIIPSRQKGFLNG
jgi:hypothetical protein